MAKKKVQQEAMTALSKLEKSGPLAAWEQEAAAEARADAAAFRQGIPRISFKGGRITVDGQLVKDNKLRVMIVDAVLEKAYFTSSYKDGEAATPVCYGFHPMAREEIKPHPAAPEKQHDQCAGCPHNVFGTAKNPDGSPGKGKRCADRVRGILIAYSDDPEALVKAEVRAFSIPPTSLGNWGQYVDKLASMGAGYRTVVTEIGIEPFKATFKVTFTAIGRLGEEGYAAVKARQPTAREQLMMPYPALSSEEKPATQPKKKKLKGQ
jgi:hypothetical protein